MLYAIALLAAIFGLSLLKLQPPSPLNASAPVVQFSAGRALGSLRFLMGEDTPHPLGSDANAAVHARLVEEFTKAGYTPETQSAFDCNNYGVCATVQNVLARLDGTDAANPPSAVLLAAHYDSVPAGPGDSDDGAGSAAVIEVARALKSQPPPLHTIIFLIDDGEEAGLLGARAFVDFHPWAAQVRAAVNIDARGATGPSLMFETGSANDWAVRLYAQSVSHPATNSIAYTAYKLLPNHTDFSIFKSAGYQGFNSAIIGNEVLYHTPLDNFQNVNAASLQHQGENALQLVRALANTDISNPPQSDAVYFDTWGHWTIHWNVRWMLPLAIVSTILLGFEIGFLFWFGLVRESELVWGLLACILEMFSIVLSAYAVARLIRLAGGIPVNWIAHPIPIESAFWCLPAGTIVIYGMLVSRRAGFWGLWASVWAWGAVLAVTLAWLAPGVSYLAVVPLVVAGLSALPILLWRYRNRRTRGSQAIERSDASFMDEQASSDSSEFAERDREATPAVIFPLAAAALVGFPPALLLYDALGSRLVVGLAALVGLILTVFSPLCVQLRKERGLATVAIPAVPVLLTVLAAFAATIMPAYSAKAPEHLNIEYWSDSDSGAAQWIAEPASGSLPEPIRLAASFHRVDRGPFPWNQGAAYLAEAPAVDLAAPTFTILEDSQGDGKRSYHALLRSERGAPVAMLLFPPGTQVEGTRVGGVPVEAQTPQVRGYFNGWLVYSCPVMPAEGVEISFSLPSSAPVEVSAVDMSYGLPPSGDFMLKARPLTAAPADRGDVTVVSRRVDLFP